MQLAGQLFFIHDLRSSSTVALPDAAALVQSRTVLLSFNPVPLVSVLWSPLFEKNTLVSAVLTFEKYVG